MEYLKKIPKKIPKNPKKKPKSQKWIAIQTDTNGPIVWEIKYIKIQKICMNIDGLFIAQKINFLKILKIWKFINGMFYIWNFEENPDLWLEYCHFPFIARIYKRKLKLKNDPIYQTQRIL